MSYQGLRKSIDSLELALKMLLFSKLADGSLISTRSKPICSTSVQSVGMKMSIASAWTLLRVSGAHPRRPRPVDWNVRPFRGGIAGKVRILSTSPMPKLLRIPRFRSRSSAVKWGIQPRCHRCPIRSRFRDNRSCRNSLCCIGEQATRACQGEIAGHIGFGRRDICVQWDE